MLDIKDPKNKIKFNSTSKSFGEKAIVFVGGYGDTKDTFTDLVKKLSIHVDQSIITFSFSGKLNGLHYSTFESQIEDLNNFLKYLQTQGVKKFTLICTSDGAVSSTYALFDSELQNSIEKVIYLDPAIYYVSALNKRPNFLWHGFVDYSPDDKVYGDLIKEHDFNTKLDVVHFTLRNFGPNRYVADLVERGEDNPEMFPRLSTKMVKAFYNLIPENNRGKYIELANMPHAFMRDGHVHKNIENLVNLITSLLLKEKK